MNELRVVGSSEDHRLLYLTDKPRGTRASFAVPIDRDLLEVLQAAVYARRDGARRERLEDVPDSAPTSTGAPKVAPREIQRLLRAGMSVERVADVLDCDEDLVERFVTPILYERSGVIQDVQRLVVEKARLGASGLSLRDSIETNLASRRIRLTDDEYLESWHATREEGQPWKLSYSFDFRGKQVARFTYDPRTGRIEPANKAALDIAWVPEGTEKPNIPPPMPGTKSRKRPSRSTSGGRQVRARSSAKPARKTARKPARKTAPKRPTARKPAAKRPTAKKAAPKRPAKRSATASRKPARKKPAARTTAKRKPAARATARKKPTTAKRKPAARRTSRR